jgi:hypothetical protein
LRNRIESAGIAGAGSGGNSSAEEIVFEDIELPEITRPSIEEPGYDLFGENDDTELNIPAIKQDDGEDFPPVGLGPGGDDDTAEIKIEFEPVDFSGWIQRQEKEIEEINRQLNELEIVRMQAGLARLNDVMMGSIHQNIDLLTSLLAVANHVSPNSHFNDLSANVPVLGSVIDYAV